MNYKYKKAVKYFQEGDLKAALVTAQRSLPASKGSERIKFLNLIGITYHQLGLYNQAVGSFQKSLEEDEDNFRTWENLGIIYRRMNNFEYAEHCFLKALELNPASDEVLTSLGVVYLFQDEVTKAIRCFEKSLEINSGQERVRMKMITVLRKVNPRRASLEIEKLRNLIKY